MQTKTGSFLSHDGKHRIHTVQWLPDDQPPKAILQIVFGMAEYAERYVDVAAYFTRHGYLVASHDHLGHGQSVRSPAEYGYFGPNGQTHLIEDTHGWTQRLKAQYPELPLILLGHSMGSLIAEACIGRYWYDTAGLILMGCVYQPKVLAPILPEIKLRAKIQGKRKDHLLNALAFGPYNRRFDHHECFSWLSSDADAVARYRADPGLGFTFTSNGFYTLFSLLQAQNDPQWLANLPKAFPILIMNGSDDAVGGFGKQTKQLQQAFLAANLKQVTVKAWPGLRHELFFERDTAQVEAYLLKYLATVV